jgi:mono/diheme cytochrome c family protein
VKRYLWSVTVLVSILLLLLLGCQGGRKSSAGFYLPDGDRSAGKAAFVDLQCSACHAVHGVADLPVPVAVPPVPVTLGGETPVAKSDGELVAAIVAPSHKVSRAYPEEKVRSGGLSRMGDFSDAMTVRQLVDIVAFLQSQYKVVPPLPVHP